MNTYREKIVQSIEQYKKLHHLTSVIGDRINELDSESMRRYLEELQVLVDVAKNIDNDLNTRKNQQTNEEIEQLLQERFSIMDSFLRLNNQVAGKINTKKAVVQSEFQKIKNGRTGIQGYQSALKKPTRIVNSTA